MYYVEFFRKKPDVSWEDFNASSRAPTSAGPSSIPRMPPCSPSAARGGWARGTRTYIIVWKIPDFARIDEWTRARRDDPASAAAVDQGTISVADMDAGVYDDIGLELL